MAAISWIYALDVNKKNHLYNIYGDIYIVCSFFGVDFASFQYSYGVCQKKNQMLSLFWVNETSKHYPIGKILSLGISEEESTNLGFSDIWFEEILNLGSELVC